MNINPIYNQFFTGEKPVSWGEFNSSSEEIETLPAEVDFSIDHRTCLRTCAKVALFILKIIIFPWAIYEGIRLILQRLIMFPIYPAQSAIFKYLNPDFNTENLDKLRLGAVNDLKKTGHIVRHVSLEKNGTRYSGLLVTKPGTALNGEWVIQATGNCGTIESMARRQADFQTFPYKNYLMVNGPGVGRSEGFATPETMGEAQEIGITFLEEAIGATKIAIAGWSIGGAAMSQAVLQHDFKQEKCEYHVITQLSFDSISNIAHNFVESQKPNLAPYVKPLIHWTGCENDTLESSRKLIELGIPETVIQAGGRDIYHHDGVIPHDATKGSGLDREGIRGDTLKIVKLPSWDHGNFPKDQTRNAIATWDRVEIVAAPR